MTIYRDVCLVGESREPPDPVELYFEVHGRGPQKIIFISGMNQACEMWELQTEFFRRFPEFQICVFDNRGVGRSGVTETLYTTRQMAADTQDLLDFLDWTEDIHVVGANLGGMIALELALAAPPGLLRSITLVSTQPGRTLPLIATLFGFAKALLTDAPDVRMAYTIDNLYPQTWLDAPAPPGSGFASNRLYVLDKLKEHAKKIPVQEADGFKGHLSAFTRHYTSPEDFTVIRKKMISSIIITGDKDEVIDPEQSKILQRELKGQLKIFEGVGHVPYVQEPDRFNEVLLETYGVEMPEDELPEFEAIEMGPWAATTAADIADDEINFDDVQEFTALRKNSAARRDSFGDVFKRADFGDDDAALYTSRKASETTVTSNGHLTNGAPRRPSSRLSNHINTDSTVISPTGFSVPKVAKKNGVMSPTELLSMLSPVSDPHGSDETAVDDFDIDIDAPSSFFAPRSPMLSKKDMRRMSRLEVELYHDAEVEDIII